MINEGSFTLKKPKEQRELVLLVLIEDKGLKTNKEYLRNFIPITQGTKVYKACFGKYNLP